MVIDGKMLVVTLATWAVVYSFHAGGDGRIGVLAVQSAKAACAACVSPGSLHAYTCNALIIARRNT